MESQNKVILYLSDGDMGRLNRLARLRQWNQSVTIHESIQRAIAIAWLAVEKSEDREIG